MTSVLVLIAAHIDSFRYFHLTEKGSNGACHHQEDADHVLYTTTA